jgi:hypothetical protein
MELYIKLLNGKPTEHPITKENMETAFPDIDLNNLPENWAKFVRVPQPKLGVYETAECFYEWDGDVVKDVWYVHPMGEEEKKQKQERVKKSWVEDGGFSNWIFDEERCVHIPPKPMPQDGKLYIWVQQATNWVEVEPPKSSVPTHNRPPYPTDGKIYDFDESTNSWVAR